MYNYCRMLMGRFPRTFKTIPTSYLDSLSYEDQLNWLCAIILELKDQVDQGGGSASEEITAEIEAIKVRLKALEDGLSALEEKVNDIDGDVAEVNNKVIALEARVSDIETIRGDALFVSTARLV